MFVRQSTGERIVRRKRGRLEDMVFDAWAAFHLSDDATIEWFLRDYLRLRPTLNRSLEDLREALYYVIGSSWADRPAKEVFENPPPWWNPAAENPKGYLYKAVREEAERYQRDREVADKPWGLKRLCIENLPEQCELNPEVHRCGDGRGDPGMHAGLTNPELIEDLIEFQRHELELVTQASEALPERQYQVFALRAEGLSYAEIAERLEISTGAAKANMFHARKNPGLRKMAEQWM